MKVLIDIDESNNMVYDKNGNYCGTLLSGHEYEEADGSNGKVSVSDLEKLHKAGFDSSDIIAMHKSGLI